MESIQGLFNEDLKRVAIVIRGHVIVVVILCLHKAHGFYCNYTLVDHDVIDMPQHICFQSMYTCVFFVCVLVRVVCALAALCAPLVRLAKLSCPLCEFVHLGSDDFNHH